VVTGKINNRYGSPCNCFFIKLDLTLPNQFNTPARSSSTLALPRAGAAGPP